ncbi:MAG TPA: outer membrane beta-barrel protein [Gemmatimonadaceae bacterium]|jgi:hypothetical protein
MRSIRRIHRVLVTASSVLLSAAAASPLMAQAPGSGTVLHVTPYAGAMVFGNYLSGPLGTSLSNAPGLLYGAQAGLSIAPNVSLTGNLGYTSSDIQVGVPIFGGISVGHSSMLIYDAGLEYDLGSMSSSMPVTPFLQAGVGAIHYNIDESVLTTQATNLAGNVGVGADLSLGKGMALRVMAKDYIGKFNFQDATGFNIDGPTANNFSFTAGLRLDF